MIVSNRLIKDDEKCKCGDSSMTIKKIEGREDDIFIFDGENGEVEVYPDFISRCLVYVDDIQEYRVVQTSKTNLKIYTDNTEEKTKKEIISEFMRLSEKKKFNMPNIEFEKYKADPSKKMKRVERRLEW